MAEIKLVIADPKTGKCTQKQLDADASKRLNGLKIGSTLKGETIDLTGYEFEITGGSDNCGFPMRKGIGSERKQVLIGKGVGFRGGRKGMRVRKTVCGEMVHDKISQVNLKITKYGSKPLVEEAPKEGAEPAEAEKAKE